MGLICWLPLTGTVENKGVSNITVTNNGATVDTNGKIGSCYSFNGNNYYISLVGQQLFDCFKGENQQFSMCMWVYHADSRRAILFGDWSLSNSIGFNIELSTGHGVRFYWNGSPDYSPGINIGASTWSHIAFTYDGTALRSYLNGSLIATRSGALAARSKTAGEFRLGRDNRTTDTALNGKLNDIRIYKDHCLSAAEVKEISQGLVLHYKLDGFNNASVLPSQYQQLEYIESSGTSYFDTGCKFNIETDACKVIFKGNDTSNNGMILASNSSKYFWFYYYGSNGIRVYGHNGSSQQGINGGNNNLNDHTMEFRNKTYYLDGVSKGSLSNTYTETTHNLWLFDRGNNVNPFKGRIYYAEIIRNETKQRIFIPAKRLSDSIAGMYDLITNTFYVSSNAAFTAGTAVGTLTIQDSSGYGHNGTIVGNLNLINNTPRYSAATNFNGSSAIKYTSFNLGNIWSAGMWFYSSSSVTTGWGALFTVNTSGGDADLKMNLYLQQSSGRIQYSANGQYDSSPTFTKDVWHHLMETFDGTTLSCYLDGALIKTKAITNAEFTRSNLYVGARSSAANGSSASNYVNAYISDFRIYCTALSADDILSLYHTAAKVDNLGGLHTFEAIENIPNIIFKIDSARGAKVFQDGLSRYTQSQCQVTLTDEGYHIYRPPNLVYSSAGKVMWGGLKLVNQTSDTVSPYNANRDNVWGLQKTHTYLFAFHAKGQSSNSPSLNVQNNMGWDRIAGMGPNPTYISTSTIPANFNGEKDCYIIFTINDDIIKTATKTEGGYTTGEQYLSYRDLSLNYGYTDTGALGTDLYLTDFRLYDVTNYIGQIKKTGITNFSDYVERNGILQIRNKAELLTSNLIEH